MSVSLRLPDDLSQRLSSLAAKTGRSKTFYMLEAIKRHIEELEDLYLADQRLLDARADRSMPHSIDDVERILPERQQPEMQEREPQMFGVVDPMAIPYGE